MTLIKGKYNGYIIRYVASASHILPWLVPLYRLDTWGGGEGGLSLQFEGSGTVFGNLRLNFYVTASLGGLLTSLSVWLAGCVCFNSPEMENSQFTNSGD